MPDIKPFQAVRYNLSKVDDLAKVVTQPYDKIDSKLQKDYYNRSPYNYVRLILGKIEPTDDAENNRYTRAKATFSEWLNQGILIREEKSAVYAYHQQFQVGDKTYERRGFVTALRVEEFGKKILPHERTLSKPKEDRFKLFSTTRKNFETVFMLYTDSEKKIINLLDPRDNEPLMQAKDDFGCLHRVWKFDDHEVVRQVQDVIKDATLLIADGHHRYETSLNVSKEIGGEGPHNYRMVTLVNIEDEGLVVLPTHRMIFNLEPFNLQEIVENLKGYFEVKEIQRAEINDQLPGTHRFVMVAKDATYRLELKDAKILDSLLPDRAEEYRRLDVTVLHTLVIEKILKIAPAKIEDHIRYIREIDKTLNKVDEGEFQLTFLMNATSAKEVKDASLAGERMPQKSTDFYPKMISGLLIYDLER